MKSVNFNLNNLLVISFLFFLIANMNLFSVICFNGAGGVYTGSENSGEGRIASIPIENYIIEGGGYYLKSNLSIQKMLQMVEWQDIQGIDYNELQKVLEEARINMENALWAYEQLISWAEASPYNKEVLEKLEAFDYYTFMIKNKLNPCIFTQVKGYLKTGDITGVFMRTYVSFIDIANILYFIDYEAGQNRLPDISVFRELNEDSANISLFGSYVARVFTEIGSNNSL